jgi:serine/threonine-protein kinase
VQAAIAFPCQFGKYVLLRPLAVGGMAEVFLAQMSGHAGFDKACVVKRVLRNFTANRQYMQMFLDEARVIARLSHPNVVQVFDMGTVDDDYFMAMEYVPGADLQIILEALPANARRLPIPVACRIIAQVAEGLDHAHRAVDGDGAPLGIVHRDVSPSNVIVSVDGVAKICDFGVAKFGAQMSKTDVGSLKGKIHYMSPEQVRGDKLDARSDLFSLGTLLYELTVGVRPFDGNGPGEIAIQILNDDPKPADVYLDGFPPELWAVISCLLAKRNTDRFSSARELQVALDELLVAWKVRASSNEVAAHLEHVLPGIGAEARAASALAARPVNLDAASNSGHHSVSSRTPAGHIAVDPTSLSPRPISEMTFGEDHGVPAPLGLELSGPSLEEEAIASRRSRARSGSSGGGFAIIAIVVLVGAAFYWLARHDGGPAPAPNATVAPATPAPPPTPAPTSTAPAKPVVAPTTASDAAHKPEVAKPEVAKPEVKPAVAPEAGKNEKPKPASATHHHHSAKPASSDEPVHALPRLPSPPPAEDDTQ